MLFVSIITNMLELVLQMEEDQIYFHSYNLTIKLPLTIPFLLSNLDNVNAQSNQFWRVYHGAIFTRG